MKSQTLPSQVYITWWQILNAKVEIVDIQVNSYMFIVLIMPKTLCAFFTDTYVVYKLWFLIITKFKVEKQVWESKSPKTLITGFENSQNLLVLLTIEYGYKTRNLHYRFLEFLLDPYLKPFSWAISQVNVRVLKW